MKVRLRPLREEDAHISIAWRNDPEVWTYTHAAGRAGPKVEDELAWIRRVNADPTCRRFAILADERYVGNVYLTDIANDDAEFHIFIGDKSVWRRGLAGEATRQMLDYGWRELGLRQVHLEVHRDNEAALRLYRTLGFAEEGANGPFIRMRIVAPPQSS